MNELSKLLSSVLMVAAGFAAASLFGPPEVVDRLQQAFAPAAAGPEALQPLTAQAAAPATAGWGDPAGDQPNQQADGWPPLAPASGLTATEPSRSATSPVDEPRPAAPALNVSWPSADASGQASEPALPQTAGASNSRSGFDAPPAAPSSASAGQSADEWLTAASLWGQAESLAKPEAPAGKLEPVRRRLGPAAPADDGWSRVPQSTARTAPVQPPQWGDATPLSTAAPPPAPPATTLADSPYGKRPVFGGTTQDALPTLDDAPHRLATLKPVVRSAPAAATMTQHVVTDGDTLASIAERYLGDATLAGEVFRLNAERLDHPDVLPIGMVLRVPESDAAPVVAQPADAFPPLRAGVASPFATVSDGAGTAPARRAPLQPVDAAPERPLTEAQRLGPVDPLYSNEVLWDAARGW